MTESNIPRKRFLQGAGAAVIGAVALPAQATATTVESKQQIPPGFSYAPGNPPEVLPIKVVRGVIESVDEGQILVRSGSSVESVPLGAKPFIWKDGPVWPRHAASRLTVGEPVTISGVTDAQGVYLDVQHVWAGSAAEVNL